MQVPTPFVYQRAGSVDEVIGLPERLGLLLVRKLRLANLEDVIDSNDLHAELGYTTVRW